MNGQGDTQTLLSTLQRLCYLIDGEGDGQLGSRINEEIQKLRANRFHLVVLGQFKRGKTTFINALLEEELLPVGVVPVTSIVTLIHHAPQKQFHVVFADGRRVTISREDLKHYITEQGNPENRKNVRYVEIFHSSEFLKDGIVLVDTPGIGSLFAHNTEATQEFIPHIDAAIVVLSADLPLTKTEYDFLDEVVRHAGKLFFVLNKSDLLTLPELEEALAYTRTVLAGKMNGNDVHVTPVSARKALLGKATDAVDVVRESNLPLFKDAVKSFTRNEKQSVLLSRSRERANGLIAEAIFNAELQHTAMMTPVVDLQSRIEEFTKQTEMLKQERKRFGYLLNGEITALAQWIEERITAFASDENGVLKQKLATWRDAGTSMRANDFEHRVYADVSETIIRDLDEWRKANEPLIVQRYERILATYTTRTNEFIKRVLQLSSDIFKVHVLPFEDIPTVSWKKSFYYNMENESTAFFRMDLARGLRVILPASAVRRQVLRQALQHATEKLSQHCSRLSYEYTYSIQESYRGFRFDLNEKMDTVIHNIKNTVEAVILLRAEQESAAANRVEQLQTRLAELRHLQTLVI